jgi:tetratricopeptide (TPR) repeat protein
MAEARQRVIDLETAARLENVWLESMESERGSAAAVHSIFREYGLDPSELPEAEAADQIRDRLISPELVAGLDGWATYRRLAYGPDDPLAARLRAVAAAADPDPWSRRVRDVTRDGSPEQMAALAAELPVETAPQTAVARLGLALRRAARLTEAESLLRRAARAHPDHVRPPFTLADLLRHSPSESTRTEALGFYRSALALRPRSTEIRNRIGVCLTDHLGRPAEGAVLFREAIRLRPGYTIARVNLTVALRKQGRKVEAVEAAREAVAADPGILTYHGLAVALRDLGREEEAKAAHQEAARFTAQTSNDHFARGNALSSLGRHDEAIAAHREAILLNPESISALLNLGHELERMGAPDEAVTTYRQALKFKPDYGPAHNGIGVALSRLGRTEEAVAAYRDAVRCEPDDPVFRLNLAIALSRLGRWEESAAEFRAVVRLKPGYADAIYSLGIVLNKLERTDEAVDAYRQAILHRPDLAEAYCNLAHIYRRRGQFRDALPLYRRGHEIGSKNPRWPYPSAEWLAEAQRLAALEPRLPAILAGSEVPAEPADTALAAAVAANRKRYARAAELYRTAFARSPAMADDPMLGKRYNAACSAARAGCGLGEDAADLPTGTREGWRRQSLAWLRAELAGWERRLTNATLNDRRMVQNKLNHWQTDRDLECVRAASALAALPEAERTEWARFWVEVKDTLARAHVPVSRSD